MLFSKESDEAARPDPRADGAMLQRLNRDPCGVVNNEGNAFITDPALMRLFSGPVLLVFGEHDNFFPPPAPDLQLARWVGHDATLVTLSSTGHEPTREKAAPAFRLQLQLHDWLEARGF